MILLPLEVRGDSSNANRVPSRLTVERQRRTRFTARRVLRGSSSSCEIALFSYKQVETKPQAKPAAFFSLPRGPRTPENIQENENEKKREEWSPTNRRSDETSVLVAVPYRYSFYRQLASRVVRLAFCSFERPPIDRRRSPWPEVRLPIIRSGGPCSATFALSARVTRDYTSTRVKKRVTQSFCRLSYWYVRLGYLILEITSSICDAFQWELRIEYEMRDWSDPFFFFLNEFIIGDI